MTPTRPVCLVAGASGTIGEAVVRRFAKAGAKLAITYREDQPQRLLSELPALGGSASAHRMDVATWPSVVEVVEQVAKTYGAIDVLINCTGTLGPIGPTWEVPVAAWKEAVEINLQGCFYLARAVLPLMVERRNGRIVYFSGGGAAYGRPYFTAYASSKAALVRFTESLALEVQAYGITVNAIAPGAVKSAVWERLREAGAAAGKAAVEELKKVDETGGVPADRAAELAYLLAQPTTSISGRLISAVYDRWERLDKISPKIMSTDAWTLRRIQTEQTE